MTATDRPAPTASRLAESAPTRSCTGCGRTQGEDAFARKRAGRAARCKDCVRTYSAAHHAAHADERRVALAERKKAQRAALRAHYHQVRDEQTCERCGGDDRVRILGPGPSPSALISAQRPLAELDAALAAGTWLCVSCSTSTTATPSAADDAGPIGDLPSLRQCILDACSSLEATSLDDVVVAATARRPSTTRPSVRVTVGQMVAAGALTRPARGRYQLPGR